MAKRKVIQKNFFSICIGIVSGPHNHISPFPALTEDDITTVIFRKEISNSIDPRNFSDRYHSDIRFLDADYLDLFLIRL